MFQSATTFNGDISKWDVSSVINMNKMFFRAASFKQKLCGAEWVRSKASKKDMFTGSSGSISQTVCTSGLSLTAKKTTRAHISHRTVPERELIVRMPISASVSTPSTISPIANTITCPKCQTFQKSGRASCCAPGGAWFRKCGGFGNQNVDHSWSEGVKACKCKFKANGMQIHD